VQSVPVTKGIASTGAEAGRILRSLAFHQPVLADPDTLRGRQAVTAEQALLKDFGPEHSDSEMPRPSTLDGAALFSTDGNIKKIKGGPLLI